ncbi:MAG: bifunctional UDP-N-acetylglucosamine diphosphorylase/glucosamine-1-phosphate N-acetyltransferase GlmU [Sedimenticolaceae bacterium]
MGIGVVILAAGQGTRMKSAMPKVLHRLSGKSLLEHVIDCARALSPDEIVVVYGHGGEKVREALAGQPDLRWAEQAEQLGTGHAVQQAMPHLETSDQVLVLYGDVPLTRPETLRSLMAAAGHGFGLLTVALEDPFGYGRIVRNEGGRVVRIVEQKDADAEELGINEVNTGIMSIPRRQLEDWIGRLSNSNAQSEYYLTDVLAMAVAEGFDIQVCQPDSVLEAEGVNNRQQLARLERAHQAALAQQLMLDGVTLRDPARIDVRGTLEHGLDTEIDFNVLLEGRVVLGDNVRIGANCVLRNATVESGCEILDNCVIEDAHIGPGSKVGPFARLRPGAELIGGVHVGNFVEIKKSRIGQGSKVNHLSYIGDCEIGEGVNIGAGTITCNYDGANKHKTLIDDRAFIGSNTALVAPVKVGAGATIGAGSVISKDAAPEKLTLTRAKQVSFDWQRPAKKK